MRILSFLILLGLISLLGYKSGHPHGAGFKISCSKCHSAKGWTFDRSVYSFDHNTTKMPLTGQHATADCRKCHISLVFSEAKSECLSCHSDIHQGTTGSDCSRCHTPASWLVNNITQIHQMSRFPLVGAHRTADCASCHKSENPLRFDVPGVNCIDCHRDKFTATTNPNHVQAGFSEDCSGCHLITSFSWTGAGFNHSFFPLEKGHSIPTCFDCHKNGTFTKIPTDCNSCHQADYLGTTSPNHATANFPTTCETCHSLAKGWKPATFDHSIFPLTQGHSLAKCEDCHVGGNYTTVSTDCYSCHQAKYLATTNPNHIAANFPTTCATCHSTAIGWTPAKYDHSAFPLTNGHANLACDLCHINGNYNITSTDCYSCHKTQYDNTTNPNHASLSFPTTCLTCHSTKSGWKPASYAQHDAIFPIYSGRHKGQWTLCSDCHTSANNYAFCNCLACHAGAHNGKYTNDKCLGCHKNGSGGGK
jgi:hypothetical protein